MRNMRSNVLDARGRKVSWSRHPHEARIGPDAMSERDETRFPASTAETHRVATIKRHGPCKVQTRQHVGARSHRGAIRTMDTPGEAAPGQGCSDFMCVASARFATPGTRFETNVRLRSQSKAAGVSIAGVHRQRQLPSASPGRFMRASLPRLSTSCKGAIASAAAEPHATSTSAGATSPRPMAGRFSDFHTSCWKEAGKASNQPRVVALSWGKPAALALQGL